MNVIHDDAVYSQAETRPTESLLTVVLTRFNMNMRGFRQGKLADDEAFRAYVDARVPIFEAICLQSLRAQTTKPDSWFLGLDSRHRGHAAALLDVVRPDPWIAPAWQDCSDKGYERDIDTFARHIRPLIGPRHRHVLTMRVDNDDALSTHFVWAAQQYAAAAIEKGVGGDDFWISFPVGAQLTPDRCVLYTRNNNAFLVRCVSVERFLKSPSSLCLEGNHATVFERGAVFPAVTVHPMWLQTIHGDNLKNTALKKLMAFRSRERALGHFDLDRDAIDRLFSGIATRGP